MSSATVRRKFALLADWRREQIVWSGVNTFLLVVAIILLLLSRCDGNTQKGEDVGLIVHTQLKGVMDHPTEGLKVRLGAIEKELRDLKASSVRREDLAPLELAIAELKECACPKKRTAAPRVSPKPVVRAPVARPAFRPTRPVVSVAPEPIVPWQPPVPGGGMPIGKLPDVVCIPGEPSTTARVNRRDVCR